MAVTNGNTVKAWLSALPEKLLAGLKERSQTLAGALRQKVEGKLSGEVLQSQSGMLRASLFDEIAENNDAVGVSLSAGAGVPYAMIQEYGGMTKAHVITAVNAKALMLGGGRFAKTAHHPGSLIPGRSYLRSSLAELAEDVDENATAAAQDIAL